MNMKAIQIEEGERVLLTVRRHWFHIAVVGIFDLLVFMLCTIMVLVFSEMAVVGGATDRHAHALAVFALACIGLVLWSHFFAAWSDDWLDVWIITDRRIIDVEQKGFFVRQVSNFPLDRIQDVTGKTNGIFAMWLSFGDVRIQTASVSRDLNMRQVPFPEEVKDLIISLLEKRSRS